MFTQHCCTVQLFETGQNGSFTLLLRRKNKKLAETAKTYANDLRGIDMPVEILGCGLYGRCFINETAKQ